LTDVSAEALVCGESGMFSQSIDLTRWYETTSHFSKNLTFSTSEIVAFYSSFFCHFLIASVCWEQDCSESKFESASHIAYSYWSWVCWVETEIVDLFIF
jgi:hypothetical protein